MCKLICTNWYHIKKTGKNYTENNMKIYELVEIHKGEEESESTIGFFTDKNLAEDWLNYMQEDRMPEEFFYYVVLNHEILEKQPWNHFGDLR